MPKTYVKKPDTCPECGSPYTFHGNIDVAPIPVQFVDEQLGRTRDWLSHRYICKKSHFFDVVIRNKIIVEEYGS